MQRMRLAVSRILRMCAVLTVVAFNTAGGDALDRDVVVGRQWKEKLGLSSDQVPKVLAAVKTREAGLQPLREQLRAAMRQLQSQLTENAPDQQVQESLLQLALVQNAVTAKNDQFDAKLGSFLLPTQRGKLLAWRSLGAFRGASETLDFQEQPEEELEIE